MPPIRVQPWPAGQQGSVFGNGSGPAVTQWGGPAARCSDPNGRLPPPLAPHRPFSFRPQAVRVAMFALSYPSGVNRLPRRRSERS